MADVRVKDLTTTATQHASDDYFDLDGSTNGSRKILASKYAHVDLNSTPAGGYILDGTNDYVGVPNNDNLNFGDSNFTVSIYAYLNSDDFNTEYNKTLVKKIDASSGFWASLITNNLQLKFNTSPYNIALSTLGITQSGYYNIDIVRESTSLYIYVNGVLKSTSTIGVFTLSTTENLFMGGDSVANRYTKSIMLLYRYYNRVLSASEIVKLWDNGKPESSQLPFEDRNASQIDKITNGDFSLGSGDTFTGWAKYESGTSTITETMDGVGGSRACKLNIDSSSSGVSIYQDILQVGKKYRVKFKAKSSVAETENLRIAGNNPYALYSLTTDFVEYTTELTADAVRLYFARHNSSPDTYIIIDDVTVVQLGCVAEYLPNYAGKYGWLETQNRLHGSTSGSPITASAGLFEHYKDIKLSVTVNTALTDVVPKGYRLKGILFNNTTANTVVINVGTSDGGTDVVNAQSVPAGLTFVSLAKIFSLTTDQILYISSGSWNSASVNVELSMSKY